jgi:hypothetical protein
MVATAWSGEWCHRTAVALAERFRSARQQSEPAVGAGGRGRHGQAMPTPGPPTSGFTYCGKVSVMAARDQVYGSTWRRLRLVILERDGHTCQIRDSGCTGVADQVDHIVSWRLGGAAFDLPNLRAACRSCNSSRGGALGGSRGVRGRFSARRPSREW